MNISYRTVRIIFFRRNVSPAFIKPNRLSTQKSTPALKTREPSIHFVIFPDVPYICPGNKNIFSKNRYMKNVRRLTVITLCMANACAGNAPLFAQGEKAPAPQTGSMLQGSALPDGETLQIGRAHV